MTNHLKQGKDIDKAVALLQAGQLVGIPTETVYGLAANALDRRAVTGIFSAKNRPSFDPLIIHVASLEDALKYVKAIPSELRILADRFMPGPLTLLLEKKDIVPDLVTSGLSRVAIRIPAHPLVQQLLAQLDFPLAAPSANPFGYISPTKAEHVLAQLADKVAYVLDGGACQVGLESTIVGIEEGQLTVFRKGGLAIEEIEALVGTVVVKAHSSSNPAAPGMLKSHYAPRKPFKLLSSTDFQAYTNDKRIGFLAFQTPKSNSDASIVLSANGDLAQAAQNLFASLRQLDEMDIDEIVAELLPEQGLGRAINDRLRRAAV